MAFIRISILSQFVSARFLICWLLIIIMCRSTSMGNECTGNNICKLTEEHSLRLFILGDWGGQSVYPYTTYIQNLTARSMHNISVKTRPQFFISTGDNFYERGVQNVNDKRFDITFDRVYKYGKSEHIPWYITSGNHDYYGNVQALMDYSKVNPRWVYPSLSYTVRYSFGKRAGNERPTKVTFFVIDTIVLCGGTIMGGYNSTSKTYVTPIDKPTGPKDIALANQLLDWLETGLRQSSDDFLFVVGHYPIYSTGIHGDTQCLREILPDILTKYKVNAYISGHEHQLQHSMIRGRNGWIMDHVISGAGSKYDNRPNAKKAAHRNKKSPETAPSAEGSLFNAFTYPKLKDDNAQGGFVYAEVRKKSASFDYYRSDGTVIYSFKTQNRKLR